MKLLPSILGIHYSPSSPGPEVGKKKERWKKKVDDAAEKKEGKIRAVDLIVSIPPTK